VNIEDLVNDSAESERIAPLIFLGVTAVSFVLLLIFFIWRTKKKA
jgi:hypothetical protein